MIYRQIGLLLVLGAISVHCVSEFFCIGVLKKAPLGGTCFCMMDVYTVDLW